MRQFLLTVAGVLTALSVALGVAVGVVGDTDKLVKAVNRLTLTFPSTKEIVVEFRSEDGVIEHTLPPQKLCLDGTKVFIGGQQYKGEYLSFRIDPATVRLVLNQEKRDVRGGGAAVLHDDGRLTEMQAYCQSAKWNGTGTVYQPAILTASGRITVPNQ